MAKDKPKAPVAPTEAPKPKEKKQKVDRIDYPGLTNEAGEAVLLKSYPTDHDSATHKPLKVQHFECESILLFHRADQAAAEATKLRAQAEEVKLLGSYKDGANAKKYAQMLKRADELKKQLEAAGFDLSKVTVG